MNACTRTFAVLVLLPQFALATDTYDPATQILTIPSVVVGNTTYLNVQATVGSILNVGGALPATVSVPLFTAMKNDVTNGFSRSFTISGWYGSSSNPIGGNGSVVVGPARPTSLNGASYLGQTIVESASLVYNGTTIPLSSTATQYINPTTYAIEIINETNPYYVVSAYTLPASVVAGQTGNFGTATVYSNSYRTIQTGMAVSGYSITSDTSTSLLYNAVSDFYDTSYNHVWGSSTIYRVTTSGSITPLTESITYFSINGSTPYSFTFTYQ